MSAAESTSTLTDLLVLVFGIRVALVALISRSIKIFRRFAAAPEPPGNSLAIHADLGVP